MARTKQIARKSMGQFNHAVMERAGDTPTAPKRITVAERVRRLRRRLLCIPEEHVEAEIIPRAKVGSDPIIKTFYAGHSPAGGPPEWLDHPPKPVSKAKVRAHGQIAVKIFKVKDEDDPTGLGAYRHESIFVQNLAILAAVAPILKKQGYHVSEQSSHSFKAPFHALYHCHDDLRRLSRGLDADDELAPFMKLFVEAVDMILKDTHTKVDSLRYSGHVSFDTAWTLFPRGTTIYSTDLQSEFLAKVASTEYVTFRSGRQLRITVKVLRFNGETFVWASKVVCIDSFADTRPVRQLRHYPVEYHADIDAVYDRLHARGQAVLDLQGVQYRCYNNVALYWRDGSTLSKHNVEGRVLIDVAGYQKYQDGELHREGRRTKPQGPEDGNNEDWEVGAWDDPEADNPFEDQDEDVDDDDDGKDNGPEKRTLRKQLAPQQQQRNKEMMLRRDDDLPFLYGLVGGYALKTKVWVEFYVEDIEPMVWNDMAYSHLVYDEAQKDLILAFVQHHSLATAPAATTPTSCPTDDQAAIPQRTLAPIEDVIIGKGQGLVILLSGPPGTGKTLMAEAVADRTHRPLVSLQAEDLGTDASALGMRLKRCLTMAAEWEAVVLLDEADVFMAERDPNNIHRNELVSIFLRELEYFRGILFLTTNLYGTIDAAFRSRVSLHLRFGALAREARRMVWRNFLERLAPGQGGRKALAVGDGEGALTEADLDEMSLWQLNGREIQNAVKMVRTWCDHKGYVMTLDRLESGIRVTNPTATKDAALDEELYD